jgi:hypothetical protein
MPTLNDDQFADAQGGASRRLTDDTKGPGRGYYVSRRRDVPVDQGGSDEVVIEGGASAADVAAHKSRNRDAALNATPETKRHDVYQGIWNDKDASYLDISDRFPGSMGGLRNALNWAMNEGRQKAIYVAGTGKTIQVHGDDPESEDGMGPVLPEVHRLAYYLNRQHAEDMRQRRGHTRKLEFRFPNDES